jgi:hypothetical protein
MKPRDITTINLNLDKHQLTFVTNKADGHHAECILPLDELISVVQICWGDSFSGMIPDALCLFVANQDSFCYPGSSLDWPLQLEQKLFAALPNLTRLELFCLHPPREFSKIKPLTGWLPGLWTVAPKRLDSVIVKEFLAKSDAKNVSSFSIWS